MVRIGSLLTNLAGIKKPLKLQPIHRVEVPNVQEVQFVTTKRTFPIKGEVVAVTHSSHHSSTLGMGVSSEEILGKWQLEKKMELFTMPYFKERLINIRTLHSFSEKFENGTAIPQSQLESTYVSLLYYSVVSPIALRKGFPGKFLKCETHSKAFLDTIKSLGLKEEAERNFMECIFNDMTAGRNSSQILNAHGLYGNATISNLIEAKAAMDLNLEDYTDTPYQLIRYSQGNSQYKFSLGTGTNCSQVSPDFLLCDLEKGIKSASDTYTPSSEPTDWAKMINKGVKKRLLDVSGLNDNQVDLSDLHHRLDPVNWTLRRLARRDRITLEQASVQYETVLLEIQSFKFSSEGGQALNINVTYAKLNFSWESMQSRYPELRGVPCPVAAILNQKGRESAISQVIMLKKESNSFIKQMGEKAEEEVNAICKNVLLGRISEAELDAMMGVGLPKQSSKHDLEVLKRLGLQSRNTMGVSTNKGNPPGSEGSDGEGGI